MQIPTWAPHFPCLENECLSLHRVSPPGCSEVSGPSQLRLRADLPQAVAMLMLPCAITAWQPSEAGGVRKRFEKLDDVSNYATREWNLRKCT